MLQTSKIEYAHEGKVFEGYCAFDDSFKGTRPAVLVAHAWEGRNDFACQKTEQMAELGYVGFAIDMYGDAYVAKSNDEKMPLIKPLIEDRTKLLGRVKAGYDTLRQMELVNPERIGAMGFCFGGMCVFDLARSGAELRGAVGFHTLLKQSGLPDKKIHAKILAMHGHDDPMVPMDQVREFEIEMTRGGVDWQLHIFGNTQHAFTNPKVHDVKSGFVYNALADKRSWVMMKDFFHEVLSS